MLEVLQSRYFQVAVSGTEKLARIVRSEVAFDSLDEVLLAWREVDAALRKTARRGRSLLIDLRRGPARNDPAFEAAVRSILPDIRRGYRRIGVLVRSAAGGLQVSRLARADGAEEFISSNEEELIAYLKEPDPS